ncbi:hypothetical protein CK203_002543 [Vitis vinifera]|uniref:Uncharacterized protein n=1 Tax=Vitis vinifera TaxID=29760 RepID=A0A438KII8_VITVI|nr:hypothetical protein CK203_002543 [Vitis vinifera]
MLEIGKNDVSPNVKGEMYILNDGMNMKAEIAAMERRLEELEMNQMQEVQAISQTPLQAMPCAICLSYEHLVEDHLSISNSAQAPQQASNLEQAMVNLCKVVGDFVGKQEAINAQINQRIDRMESTLNKRMDEMQNDMAQKLDILQDSISSIHEMESKEGEPSQKREVKEVITLRSGKEVDLPTCKLEHKVESETEKEKREEIKGKKKGKSFWMIKIKRNCKEIEEKNRSKIGAKSESNGAKTGEKQGKNRVCEISQPLRNRNFAAKPVRNPIALSAKIFAAAKPILAHECHFAAQEPPFRSCESGCEPSKHEILHFAGKAPFGRVFGSCEPDFGTRVPFRSTEHPFLSCETHCEVVKPEFAPKVPFRRVFRNCEAGFGTRVPFAAQKVMAFEDDCANHERKCRTSISLLLNIFEALPGAQIMHTYLVSKLGKSGVQCFKRYQLRAPVEETMPPKETTRTEAKVLIQPIQEATTDASAPQDLTIT